MISFLAEAIGIRDDMYLGEGNRYMREVAAALQEGYEQGVLARRPSVINLQCDIDHPTQTLADLLHLESRFGGLAGLRGRKFVISWAYSPSYGKPLSVPQGLIGLLPRFGMDVTLAHPEGYELLPEVIDLAGKAGQGERRRFPRQRMTWTRPSRAPRSSIPSRGRRCGSPSAAPSCCAPADKRGLAGPGKGRPGGKRPPQGLALRRSPDEATRPGAQPSTCTACRRTSAACPARRAK